MRVHRIARAAPATADASLALQNAVPQSAPLSNRSETLLRELVMPSLLAEPYEFCFDPGTTALIVVDMQRDFVDPGGFGEALGNDVSLLRAAVPPTERVLCAVREAGLLVIHTREGHR